MTPTSSVPHTAHGADIATMQKLAGHSNVWTGVRGVAMCITAGRASRW